jgi:chromatin remodeling complex protein RSC6
MSGLTKRIIYADRYLAAILGVNEGSLVSYADISKGIHAYIKKNDLKNPKAVKESSITPEVIITERPAPTLSTEQPAEIRKCRDCGEIIPFDAVYCDMCGIAQ